MRPELEGPVFFRKGEPPQACGVALTREQWASHLQGWQRRLAAGGLPLLLLLTGCCPGWNEELDRETERAALRALEGAARRQIERESEGNTASLPSLPRELTYVPEIGVSIEVPAQSRRFVERTWIGGPETIHVRFTRGLGALTQLSVAVNGYGAQSEARASELLRAFAGGELAFTQTLPDGRIEAALQPRDGQTTVGLYLPDRSATATGPAGAVETLRAIVRTLRLPD